MLVSFSFSLAYRSYIEHTFLKCELQSDPNWIYYILTKEKRTDMINEKKTEFISILVILSFLFKL